MIVIDLTYLRTRILEDLGEVSRAGDADCRLLASSRPRAGPAGSCGAVLRGSRAGAGAAGFLIKEEVDVRCLTDVDAGDCCPPAVAWAAGIVRIRVFG